MKDELNISATPAVEVPDEKLSETKLRIYDPLDIDVVDVKKDITDLVVRRDVLMAERISTQASISFNNKALQKSLEKTDADIAKIDEELNKKRDILTRAGDVGIIV